MNSKETKEIWKRKLIELKEKVRKLNNDKNILVNLLNESKSKKKINLYNPYYEIELKEKISYINDWVGFHLKDIEKYENKLKELEGKGKDDLKRGIKDENIEAETGEDIKDSFKLIFSETEEDKPKAGIGAPEIKTKEQIIERVKLFKAQIPFVKYAISLAILLLIISSLFLFKPNISGYVVLNKEAIYNENLNLKINESGNYMWAVNKSGEIKSIRASGSFSGNGTVKIYIQKDGKKYLIFDNKKLNNASVTG